MPNIFKSSLSTLAIEPWLRLTRIHKPAGTLLLLWPTLAGLWLASNGRPNWSLFVIFVCGTFIMRAAGCIANDLADKEFDGWVQRTRDRPLVTGEISATGALICMGGLLFIAFILVWQLNWFTFALALVALLLTMLYPFAKRVTFWPQLVLGLTFNLGILMAFTAAKQQIALSGWLLYTIAVIWTLAFDTLYAIADRPDDQYIGIKSTARLLGHYDRIFITGLQSLVFMGLIILGYMNHLNLIYYVSLTITAGLFIYQYGLYQHYDRQQSIKAFINNHWAWLSVLAAIILGYI